MVTTVPAKFPFKEDVTWFQLLMDLIVLSRRLEPFGSMVEARFRVSIEEDLCRRGPAKQISIPFVWVCPKITIGGVMYGVFNSWCYVSDITLIAIFVEAKFKGRSAALAHSYIQTAYNAEPIEIGEVIRRLCDVITQRQT